VVEILDEQGRSIKSFQYDPFGNTIHDQHGHNSQFSYMGQWGKMSFSEIPGIQLFGHRIYDSELGRFLNKDRQGIFCKNPNLYIYMRNNPLQMASSEDNTQCHTSDPGKL
jgi:RHS repeat-associated protein